MRLFVKRYLTWKHGSCRSDGAIGFLVDSCIRLLTPCKKHQGRYSDIAAAMIPEIIKSNGLANAPVQSLLTVINGVLDESIERKNGAIHLPVAGLLIKVVQEIERRIAAQAELIRDLHNQIRSREDKYQSRMRVLEVLAYGANEETQILCNQLQILKAQKTSIEEKKKTVQQHVLKLTKEKENSDKLILELRKELETMKYTYENHCQQLENEVKLKESRSQEKIKELELLLSESRKKVNELEASSESKFQIWNKKENVFNNFISFQLESVKGLRLSSESVKVEVLNSQRKCMEEINGLDGKLKALVDAAQNYHTILAENRKLYNEVQELKGNIRVYCRIRPFLPGQNDKPTAIDYIGENGELLLVNSSRQAKDGHRMFKFNKVFGQTATQAQIFLDIQPLIRSVLDGYNVCIFAYGQTGSGKTYTMTGLNSPSKEELGVNYRALSDLFHICRSRKNAFAYEVGVQMVEIYNEQVRDLLSNSASQKRLGIWSTTLPHGLAVPDASMVPVKTTSDVLELMQLGQSNRAVGSTAINERSSRSHSILTVHVRGVDLKTGSTSRGCLHLIDLAGSERVERSEATGDRLKEAQHINKSLSALGDVIFALSQKSTHVPYRNSKLTQVLQSSLGGQAKALMFVQINPDLESYSETLSTLKFAERVSGVELGAAKSNKEGKDIKDLIEQVASLKGMIARKDEEIEHLKMLNDLTTQSHKSNSLCQSTSSPECSFGGISSQAGGNIVKLAGTCFPDLKMMSEFSNINSDATSQLLMFNGGNAYDNSNNDDGNGSSGNVESNGRLSDASACDLPFGEEGENSMGSTVESAVPPWTGKPSEIIKEKITKSSSRIHKSLPYRTGHGLPRRAKSSDSLNSLFLKKPTSSQVATANQMKG